MREGRAPEALADLDAPDAVFIGGGLSDPGLIDRCWDALRPGGRLVANAVTLEGEQVLLARASAHGGELTRLQVEPRRAAGRLQHLAPAVADRAVERPQGVDVTVHFIGAGPGAPDLLTLRGARLIAECPVCVYAGSLVPAEVLGHAPAGARLVDTQHLSLDEIVEELQRGARARR